LPNSRSGSAVKGGPSGPSEASREAAPLTAARRRLPQRIADDDASLSYIEDQYDADPPDADEPFEPDEVPGFVESTWPLFPKAGFDQLPESVKTLGSVLATAFDGDLLHMDEERRTELAQALADEGWRCFENDDLIERACGAWRYGL
jgi:hypothetical protein